jgi:GT2 family glycosyltransferase
LAIVQTYNEHDDLRRVVDSLTSQNTEGMHNLVVNAGEPLPADIAGRVEEARVSADHYWTHCVAVGFAAAAERDFAFIYMTNADTYALPGTVQALLGYAMKHERTVACAPAYLETQQGVRLLYSHQDPMGVLLYGRLVRAWSKPEEAPDREFEIILTGGQGVLFPSSVAREFPMDEANFPHYASDHDLWLRLRKAGWRLVLLPKTGVVNTRLLSASPAGSLGKKLRKLWWRMTSDKTPESWRIMWRLRRKHLALPLAVVSTLVSFGLRWTVGLRKILRRT